MFLSLYDFFLTIKKFYLDVFCFFVLPQKVKSQELSQ